MKKRILSSLMALALIITLLPAGGSIVQAEELRERIPGSSVEILDSSRASPGGEGPEKAFDEDISGSKWCVTKVKSGTPEWLAFTLPTATVLSSMDVSHAGTSKNNWDASSAPVSELYSLEVLDTSKCTEEDFLSKEDAEQRTILEDAGSWIKVGGETANTTRKTKTSAITMTEARRVFRFSIDKTGDCVRVMEIALYKDLVAPTAITVEPVEITAGRMADARASFTVEPADASKHVTYSVDSTDIVYVSETGELTGLKPGTATLTVTSRNAPSVFGTCTVTVNASDAAEAMNAALNNENSALCFAATPDAWTVAEDGDRSFLQHQTEAADPAVLMTFVNAEEGDILFFEESCSTAAGSDLEVWINDVKKYTARGETHSWTTLRLPLDAGQNKIVIELKKTDGAAAWDEFRLDSFYVGKTVPPVSISIPQSIHMTVGSTFCIKPDFMPINADVGIRYTLEPEGIVDFAPEGVALALYPGTATLTMVSTSAPEVSATTQIEVTTDARVKELSDALNVPGGTLVFGNPDGHWDFTAHDGRFCAKSSIEGQSSTSATLNARIEAKEGDILAFEYWGGSEWSDEFFVMIDGERAGQEFDQANEWTAVVKPLTAGSHRISFCYRKDSSVSYDPDAYWLDNVYVGPPADPTAITLPESVTLLREQEIGIPLQVEPFYAANDVQLQLEPEGIAEIGPDGHLVALAAGTATLTATSAVDPTLSAAMTIQVSTESYTEKVKKVTDTPDNGKLKSFISFDENLNFSWAVAERDGRSCMMTTNKGIDRSYSILEAVAAAEDGDVLYFEYIGGGEPQCDELYLDIYDKETEESIYEDCIPAADQWTPVVIPLTKNDAIGIEWVYEKDSGDQEMPDAIWLDHVYIGPQSAPESIELPAELRTEVGQAIEIPTIIEPYWADREFTYTVQNGEIATVTEGKLVPLKAGETTLTVTSVKAPTVSATAVLTVTDSVPLDDALNVPGGKLTFTSGAEGVNGSKWVTRTLDGRSCAMSTAKGIDRGRSTLSTTVVAGKEEVLSFDYLGGGESGSDFLTLEIDGGNQAILLSGTSEWTRKEISLEEGTHTLLWTYQKDGSVNVPPDAYWLDNIYVGVSRPVVSIDAPESIQVPIGQKVWLSDYITMEPVYIPNAATFSFEDPATVEMDLKTLAMAGHKAGTNKLTVQSKGDPSVTREIEVIFTEDPVPGALIAEDSAPLTVTQNTELADNDICPWIPGTRDGRSCLVASVRAHGYCESDLLIRGNAEGPMVLSFDYQVGNEFELSLDDERLPVWNSSGWQHYSQLFPGGSFSVFLSSCGEPYAELQGAAVSNLTLRPLVDLVSLTDEGLTVIPSEALELSSVLIAAGYDSNGKMLGTTAVKITPKDYEQPVLLASAELAKADIGKLYILSYLKQPTFTAIEFDPQALSAP